jgi:hypothetical protein
MKFPIFPCTAFPDDGISLGYGSKKEIDINSIKWAPDTFLGSSRVWGKYKNGDNCFFLIRYNSWANAMAWT